MKVKEAVNRIESASKSTFAWEHEGYIHISWNAFTILVVPYEAKTMFDCHFVNPNLGLPADVKAQLSGIIGKFLRTPIKERYPDKKYTIQAIANSDYCYLNYGKNSNRMTFCDDVETDYVKTRFTQSEIDELKQRPDLAIDWDKAIIKEVKDDE